MKQNIDTAEVDKFANLASRWWDKDSEFKPLHEINPLRLSYIQQYTDTLQKKSILDVGCGGGILSESLAQLGANVTGIDMAGAGLEVAKLHLLESKLSVTYKQTTVEEFAKQHSKKFDIVVCMEMLEHVPSPESIIESCAKLVKPNGLVFFSTLNRNLKAYLFAIVGAEYVLGLLPKGTHDYEKFIKPSELSNWTRNNKLKNLDMTGMLYNPLTKIYSLDKDVSVNYLLATQKM